MIRKDGNFEALKVVRRYFREQATCCCLDGRDLVYETDDEWSDQQAVRQFLLEVQELRSLYTKIHGESGSKPYNVQVLEYFFSQAASEWLSKSRPANRYWFMRLLERAVNTAKALPLQVEHLESASSQLTEEREQDFKQARRKATRIFDFAPISRPE